MWKSSDESHFLSQPSVQTRPSRGPILSLCSSSQCSLLPSFPFSHFFKSQTSTVEHYYSSLALLPLLPNMTSSLSLSLSLLIPIVFALFFSPFSSILLFSPPYSSILNSLSRFCLSYSNILISIPFHISPLSFFYYCSSAPSSFLCTVKVKNKSKKVMFPVL